MKAIYYEKYGSTDNFYLKEIEKPEPGDNEVLVKIHAASINSWDWDLVRGIPRIYRLLFGLFKPKYNIIGIDVAGSVESVGSHVQNLKVGDEVYGDISESGFGAFAEYTCVAERFLAPKPANISLQEAAAIPHGGVLALQSVESNGVIQSGQQVLINGAGGSTGPFALQMAKMNGATVTCVDKADKFDMLRSFGADHLVDYTKENFVKINKKYDLIIDLVARHSAFEYFGVLNPNGAVCIVGGDVSKIIQAAFISSVSSRLSGKKISVLALKPCRENLERLTKLIEEGQLKVIIDNTFPLEQVPQAIQYLGEGRSVGKLVISIAS